MNILILGSSGMLGSSLFRLLSNNKDWNVRGTVRSPKYAKYFHEDIAKNLFSNVNLTTYDDASHIFEQFPPDVIINCIGIIKQVASSDDPISLFTINSILPKQLGSLAKEFGARMIHISTDCIFNGRRGNYKESDICNAEDSYGKSKFLGELDDSHCVTLRTSIIGHELNSKNSLVEWFLSQKQSCHGYTNAIFSGLPTVILANIISDIIIPIDSLNGIYNVAAKPISKLELLRLIADIYMKDIEIIPVDTPVINRSLNPEKFNIATGYESPDWFEMIRAMHNDYMRIKQYV